MKPYLDENAIKEIIKEFGCYGNPNSVFIITELLNKIKNESKERVHSC